MHKNKEKKDNINQKKPSFWNMFLFNLIITFVGFGGGNALIPTIKKYAVDKYKWLDEKEFDEVVITANLIPGTSVIEMQSYIAIKFLGKIKGILVILISNMPSILFFLGIYIGLTYISHVWLYVITAAILPVIIAMIILFVYNYVKISKKEIGILPLFLLFIFTFAFTFFVPAPFNIPAICMIVVILSVFLYEFIRIKVKNKKNENGDK